MSLPCQRLSVSMRWGRCTEAGPGPIFHIHPSRPPSSEKESGVWGQPLVACMATRLTSLSASPAAFSAWLGLRCRVHTCSPPRFLQGCAGTFWDKVPSVCEQSTVGGVGGPGPGPPPAPHLSGNRAPGPGAFLCFWWIVALFPKFAFPF